MITLKDVSKSFKSSTITTKALSEISLFIDRGEFLIINGPSGCGKSTLLSVIGLLEYADAGQVILNGESVGNANSAKRARLRNEYIGFVFQSFFLVGDLNVLDNVMLPLKYSKKLTSKTQRLTAANEILERVGLAHRKEHFPSQLSGGQQQRVALGRALVTAPPIIVADEPTGNLDPVSANHILALLSELNDGGTTICMVTHDPDHQQLADRVLSMEAGTIKTEV